MIPDFPNGGFESEDELIKFITDYDLSVHLQTKEELECFVCLVERNGCKYTNMPKFEYFTQIYYRPEIGWYINFCVDKIYLFVHGTGNVVEFEDLYKELV